MDEPVASNTGFPSAFVTEARVIAIVRPLWTTSARAVRSVPSGGTGRRKFAFRSRPAIATPGPAIVSTGSEHREVGLHRDHASLEAAGGGREPFGRGKREGGPSLADLGEPQPGEVMKGRRRELTGELAAQDLRAD